MTSVSLVARLDELVLDACKAHGELVAVRDGKELSYTEFARIAERLSSALAAAGQRPGQPVLLAVSNDLGDFAAQIGCWRAEAVVVPVSRSSPAAAVRETAARVGARFLVTTEELMPASWAQLAVPAGDGIHRLPDGDATPVPAELDRDQALVIFTSGSTGRPKGVVLSHAAFAAKLDAIRSALAFGPGDVTLQPLHLHFSFGQWTSLLTLMTGGTIEAMQRYTARASLDRLAAGTVTRMPVVPTMLRMLLAELPQTAGAPAPPGPGLWIAGGEPLAAGLGRQVRSAFPRSGMSDVFGLSESCTSDFIVTPDKYDELAGTLGAEPSPGVEARLVDPASGQECAPGQVGELRLRTPYLMTGYLDDPEATAAAMDGPWLRTGDLAIHTTDGRVQLVGRSKNLIVRGATKVSPLEVEAVYSGFPGCHGALAIGSPDPILGERINLILAVPAGTVVTVEAAREWGRARVDRHKLPDAVYCVDALPLGRTGKLDRTAGGDLVAAMSGSVGG